MLLLHAGDASAQRLTKPPRVTHFVTAERPASSSIAPDAESVVSVFSIAISSTGQVTDASLVQSAGDSAYDAAALAAVRQLVFEPAEIDGKPAPIRILYRYEFKLTRDAAKEAASFRGTVRDRGTGQALAGVEVAVLPSPGEAVPALRSTTDADGHFEIRGISPGKHAVSLQSVARPPDKAAITNVRTEETFEAGRRLEASYDVVLPSPTESANDSGEDKDDLEIVVVAPAITLEKVVTTQVSADEGRRFAGTQGDVLKVVESMPGVARSQVGSGQLVVWGAAPADTRVYVDGVRVPRLYHGGGVRSIVATDLVDSVELAPGGYGAAWGRGLGGLVSVRTRQITGGSARSAGRPPENETDEPRLRASASVDVIDAGATVRAPVTKDVHVAIAARRSHLHSTIAPFADDSTEDLFPIPRYEDAQARVAWQPTSRDRLDITGLHSSDRITRAAPSNDPLLDRRESRRLSFERVYARYEHKDANNATTSVVPWVGVDRSVLDNRFGGIPASLEQDATLGGVRATWTGRVHRALTVAIGLDGEVSVTKVARAGSITTPAREGDVHVFGQIPTDRINADRWTVLQAGIAPWVELDAAPFGDDMLHIVPGVRFDPYLSSVSRKTPIEGETPSIGAFSEHGAIEPRLAVRWQPARRLSLRTAYGRYHQQALPEDLSAVFGNPLLPTSSAHHFIGGSTLRLTSKTSVETTAFYTIQDDIAVRSTLSSPLLAEALVPAGSGKTFGAQFLLRQELAHGLNGWVSYTLSRSLRKDGTGDYRLSDHDQSHVLTAVGSYAFGKTGFEIGARLRASAGFPRTPVVGALYGTRRDISDPLFGPKNTERIPAYLQLDVRAAKRWATSRFGEFEAYLEVQNVTNRVNPEEIVYSSNYAKRDYLTGLPILPILGGRWSL